MSFNGIYRSIEPSSETFFAKDLEQTLKQCYLSTTYNNDLPHAVKREEVAKTVKVLPLPR